MINLLSPEAIADDRTSSRITAGHWVNVWSGNVFCSEILWLKGRRCFIKHVLFTNPNGGHLPFFPVSEEAEEVLPVHDFIEILLLEEDVPLEVLVDRLVDHEPWHESHCHRGDHSQAAKVDEVVTEVCCAQGVQGLESAIWEDQIKLGNS